MPEPKLPQTSRNGSVPAPPAPGPEREQMIRARAHALWEEEGCPDGRHTDHWWQAEQEHAEAVAPPDGTRA